MSAAIFGHDITNFNAANLEVFRVNTFVNFLISFIGEKINKGLRPEEIHSFSRLKLSN